MTLNEAIKTLAEAGVESPEYDARELFLHFGNLKPYELVSRDISLGGGEIISAIERRAKKEPLQYIVGEVNFYRESYKVTPDCLIPRQDTEILVDYAVKNIPWGESFIDLCTGSGCVAISTLKNTDNTRALALDISQKALNIAKENAEKNGVFERIDFELGDALNFSPRGRVFAILSNPPYVTNKEYEELAEEIYHEPKEAFVGGADGLDFYKKIVPACKDKLKTSGFIAFEIGKDQAQALEKIAEDNAMNTEIINDFSGLARVAVLRKK